VLRPPEAAGIANLVLILKADCASSLALSVAAGKALPDSPTCLSHTCEEALELLCSTSVRLAILGATQAEYDHWPRLPELARRCAGRPWVLVTDSTAGRVLRALRGLGATGLCSLAHDRGPDLVAALRAIAAGQRHASAPLDRIMRQSPESWPERILSPLEERVLTQVWALAESAVACRLLVLREEAARKHCGNIVRKLGLKGMRSLLRAALRHGYVCTRRDGTILPGMVAFLGNARSCSESRMSS
jgi:DNA-binding NarL/FixJ family response regulator